MTGRRVAAVPVPDGAGALDALVPALREALSGAGPAVHPHPAGRTPHPAVGAGAPLGEGEDEPADPTAAVVATSGSTGTPKPALLPASALLAAASAAHDRLGGPGTWLLGVPAHTVAGVMVAVRSLVAGRRPVAVDLSGGFRPEAFAAAAEEALHAARGGRCYAAVVPTQLSRLLGPGEEAAGPSSPGVTAALAVLARFDAVLSGGAAVPQALRERAAEAGVRLVTGYGSSETCGGCVYDGVALDGVAVTLDGGDTGRISVEGPVVARGYRSRPGDPAFGVGPRGLRLIRTEDTGHLEAGRLVVDGRLDDMVTTGGWTVAPQAVEEVLAAQPGVAEVLVAGVPDEEWGQRVVAAVVAAPGTAPDAGAWRAAVAAALGRWAVPEVRLVDALPLVGPGKPDRRALAGLLHPSTGG